MIEWKYFFGASYKNGYYDRYYKAEVKGVRVEKHVTPRFTRFAIGNIDEAKIKFDSENELIQKLHE